MPAKLGLGTYAFRWSIGMGDRRPPVPMTAMQVVDEARTLGLDFVQFADNLPLHGLDEDGIARLARHAAASGIGVELGIQGFDGDVVRRYLGLAERLDAHLLRIAFDAADARKDVGEIARALQALLPACRTAGVRLAIENHFHVPSPKLVEIVRAVGDDALGICLDVANSICAKEWPEDTIALLAPDAIELHLKDYRFVPDPYGVGFRVLGSPLGEGTLDIDHVFASLRREVDVVLEHWLPFQKDLTATAALERAWLVQSVQRARRYVG